MSSMSELFAPSFISFHLRGLNAEGEGHVVAVKAL